MNYKLKYLKYKLKYLKYKKNKSIKGGSLVSSEQYELKQNLIEILTTQTNQITQHIQQTHENLNNISNNVLYPSISTFLFNLLEEINNSNNLLIDIKKTLEDENFFILYPPDKRIILQLYIDKCFNLINTNSHIIVEQVNNIIEKNFRRQELFNFDALHILAQTASENFNELDILAQTALEGEAVLEN